MNPFVDQDDPTLVAAAQSGDRDALTEVISRHRPWIYNVALRMMGDAGSAEDATQDIFIKVLKKIGSFEGRSSFRTWLYRVAFNQLLNAKRSVFEQAVGTFEEYGAGLDATPNSDLDDIPQPERELLVEEAMTACMTGMLLCLSREQRIAYVLGTLFSGHRHAGRRDLGHFGADLPQASPTSSRRSAQFHERQMRPHQQGQPLSLRSQDTRVR